jgi:hypothetical protein
MFEEIYKTLTSEHEAKSSTFRVLTRAHQLASSLDRKILDEEKKSFPFLLDRALDTHGAVSPFLTSSILCFIDMFSACKIGILLR